ncbi:dTDP-4-dehydrorhamnose 3,5-epimerase [Filimonas lacunae]|uniref:dTDP-4-dehydrorhamnose 3,5-epimerase n=1 Tax=Filimonas lacunae TaxID=477680 RepID=A0A173MS40_9BACT|nr:dTDP-4-dehydrorhamnose 3,5-epimerase [Filimonas lacunae]BAV10211.1 dTDP-4-dehydrorhamnose 3,5-epimerase [Filimonas lacunae]SIT18211.1 dTDP-4-dehydrorhamnose 3,5-epimerase [Filimonas lacunae]
MKAEKTKLDGCFIIHDTVFHDSRGYFFESFNRQKFADQTGWDVSFVQDNQSFSSKGVLRGLHFQKGDAAQAKLVRALTGKVLDVAVDIRKDSPTYGEHVAVELTAENGKQLFIPRGFAHGFVVLSETATFFYKCDNYYNKAAEGGLIYNDADINIDWQLSSDLFELSEKDLLLPTLKSLE